jgi:hypothetical protein
MAEELQTEGKPKGAEKKPFPWLVVGGGLAAAGAVWWFFLRKSPEEEAAEKAGQVVQAGGDAFAPVDATDGAGGAGGKTGKGKGRSIVKPKDVLKAGLKSQLGIGPRQMPKQTFRPSQASGGSRQAAAYIPAQRTPIPPPPSSSGGRRR